MIDKDDLEKVKERARKRSKEIFRPAPPEIEKELKNVKTLGSPKNLVRPDNKNE
jgi:hypothetical protein